MIAQTAITIRTLGDALDHGYCLTGHCRACNRHQVLDLAVLAYRLGRSHPAAGNPQPLRLACSSCGGRDVGVLVSAPDRGPLSRPSA